MPHPTPTAATSASPPPRGEGMGVGGRHTLRGRIHGAPLLLALLLPLPALAQVIPTGTPAADILLSQAITEHRIFLTCTALDASNHQVAVTFWQDDVAAAVAILTEKGAPAEAIAAFSAAAQPEALLPATDTVFAEVQTFCAAQDKWFLHWSSRDFIELGQALPAAFP